MRLDKVGNGFAQSFADVANYRNTAYGAIMAATDFVDHRAASRMTNHFDENRWNVLMNGSPFVDELTSRLMAA